MVSGRGGQGAVQEEDTAEDSVSLRYVSGKGTRFVVKCGSREHPIRAFFRCSRPVFLLSLVACAASISDGIGKEHPMSSTPMEQKPRTVRRGELCLIIFVVGVFVKVFLKLVIPLMEAGILHTVMLPVVIRLLALTPWAILVYFILKGRNWARVSFLILFGLDLLWLIFVVTQSPAELRAILAIYATPTLFGIAGCFYLLRSETSAWFKAVKDHRKREKEDRRPAVPEEQTPPDSERPPTIGRDEPLFVLRYDSRKHAVRIVFLFLCVVFFGFVACAASIMDVSDSAVLIVRIMAGAALIWSLFLLVEALLFKEVRLYRDRMVKVRKRMSAKEIVLERARYVGASGVLGTPRSVFHQGSSSWIGRITGISYDEDLVPTQDVGEMNGLLADLSGRPPRDFTGVSIDLNSLIKQRPTGSP